MKGLGRAVFEGSNKAALCVLFDTQLASDTETDTNTCDEGTTEGEDVYTNKNGSEEDFNHNTHTPTPTHTHTTLSLQPYPYRESEMRDDVYVYEEEDTHTHMTILNMIINLTKKMKKNQK